IAAGAGQPQTLALEGLDVLGPLVDQRHVVPGPREESAHHTADRARADDADTHAHGRGAYREGGPVTMLMGGPEMAPQPPQRFTGFQRSAVHMVATPSGLTVAAPRGRR